MFDSPKVAKTRSFPALALFTLTAVSLCTAQELPTVRSVAVLHSGEAIELEIQTSQRLTPQVQVLSGPDRIIVDFPGALPGPGLRSVVVQRQMPSGSTVQIFLIFSERGRACSRPHLAGPYPWTIWRGQSQRLCLKLCPLLAATVPHRAILAIPTRKGQT
jgi:hypothetical protein